MSNLLLSFLIGLIPIALWGIYFYVKNPRKQPISEIIKIFALGTLSIVPVLLFHQWLLGKVVFRFKEMWSFLNIPFFESVLEMGLLLIFIGAFIIFFSLIHSLITRIFYQLPLKESFNTVYKRLYSLAPILLVFALFLLIEILANIAIQTSFILSLAGSTIVFAVLEEYFKYIINPFLVYKKVNSIGTAMVYALYVGLAFAFVENILFFYKFYGSPDFFIIFAFRSLITTVLHVCASGILGYFYGISLFSKAMIANYEIEKSAYKIPKWMAGWLKKDTMFKSSSVTQGFFLAALLHSLFNLLLHLNLRNAAAGLVVIMAIAIVMMLKAKSTQIQYGLIGSATMPKDDFEKLRLQISVLQHTKEIQKLRMTVNAPMTADTRLEQTKNIPETPEKMIQKPEAAVTGTPLFDQLKKELGSEK